MPRKRSKSPKSSHSKSKARNKSKSRSKSKLRQRTKSKSIRYGGSHVDGQPFEEFKMPSEYKLDSKEKVILEHDDFNKGDMVTIDTYTKDGKINADKDLAAIVVRIGKNHIIEDWVVNNEYKHVDTKQNTFFDKIFNKDNYEYPTRIRFYINGKIRTKEWYTGPCTEFEEKPEHPRISDSILEPILNDELDNLDNIYSTHKYKNKISKILYDTNGNIQGIYYTIKSDGKYETKQLNIAQSLPKENPRRKPQPGPLDKGYNPYHNTNKYGFIDTGDPLRDSLIQTEH
jgi:hypothetical protein